MSSLHNTYLMMWHVTSESGLFLLGWKRLYNHNERVSTNLQSDCAQMKEVKVLC